MSEKSVVEYPECEKWSALSAERQTITAFLEWLESGPDGDGHPDLGGGRIRLSDDWGDPLPWNHNETVMRYLRIDPVKLETERRAMLEAQRRLNLEG